jgi:hypothetical protein
MKSCRRASRYFVSIAAIWFGAVFGPLLQNVAFSMNLTFCCRADNDLYRVLTADGSNHQRFNSPADAVNSAMEGSGVLILADEYPEGTTTVEPDVFDEAARKKLRVYVEYPASLPDLQVRAPKEAELKRGVVTSEIFGKSLCPMRIVAINGCRYVTAWAEKPHLVLAKVAGVDKAVFGLKDTPTDPLLFDHPRGNLLVATTKLSQFVTGRYMPQEAWRTIWQTILGRLQPGAPAPALVWTPTVRPTYGRDEPLPSDVELQALRRSADWVIASRILRHPTWPKQSLDWALTYNTVRNMPAANWPLGDGSLGILEGYSSTIHIDGGQPMRYAMRNDAACESAMLMAFDASVSRRPANGKIAVNLLDYIFLKSGLAGGHRAASQNAAYGLVGWALDGPGIYWGDDNARAMLGMMATAALLKDSRWNDALVRCLLANLRTTGIDGYRLCSIGDADLEKTGWKHYWQDRQSIMYSPHMEGWLWACFLWAYDKTGFEPFLTRSRTGLRMLMEAYPNKWQWVNRSGSIERARALLPLAWLVRAQDTPEHRRWLRTIAQDLVALQAPSGAIRETIGSGGYGTVSNAEYGTGETSLIQTNGDPVSDMLYTCNFALIGLHEAAAATGDAFYAEAEEKLAKFLCRIQVRSEKHPELDGAWYRAFNFRNWEYWASGADWEWGPWCTETGWTQPWIAGTLALRRIKTSLWDLTKQSRISDHFDRFRKTMLPDEVLTPEETKK